jgi:Transposase DDE domain
MSTHIGGLILGDKGYIRPMLSQELYENGLNLLTPVRTNMKKGVWEKAKIFFGNTRRRVETVISQLSERLHIEKVRARDSWHLTARWARKLLTHTIAIWINKLRSADPLDFDGIISDF